MEERFVAQALPSFYERVLGEEPYVEHLDRSPLAAGAGRSGAVGQATASLLDTWGRDEHVVGWIERNYASGDLGGP